MASGDRVTICGGGIFGLACAYEMARRGARVRVIEPRAPGAGASGGTVGALAPHVPGEWSEKKRFQFDSLMQAEGFWAGVQAVSGQDPGYARLGRLQPVADERAAALAEKRGAAARACWGEAAVWQLRAVSDFRYAPVSPTGLVLFDSLSARIAPRRAIAALAGAIVALGGSVVPDGPEDGAVLHATGWQGLDDLSRIFGRFIGHGEKGQSALLACAAPDAPQVYGNGVHVVPHADGTTAIGSTTERDYDDPASTDTQLDDLIARARALCPWLGNAPVIDRWASARPRSVTRGPLLGRFPGREGHFIANGGFKIGFGLAPKIAAVMADLILDGHDAIPEDFRFAAALQDPA